MGCGAHWAGRARMALVLGFSLCFTPFGARLALDAADVSAFVTEGASMEPAFTGHAFGIRIPYWIDEPGRGDVVSFPSPLGGDETFVKRVVGLPGEIVEATADGIRVNGEPLAEPYARPGRERHAGRWQLRAGEYFVLGDNRGVSLDSRSFGPVRGSELSRLGIVSPESAADGWAVVAVIMATLFALGSSVAFSVVAARQARSVRGRIAWGALGFVSWALAWGLAIAWKEWMVRRAQSARAIGAESETWARSSAEPEPEIPPAAP